MSNTDKCLEKDIYILLFNREKIQKEGILMFNRVRLDTYSDVVMFNKICSQIKEPIYLTNKDRKLLVSAQSLLGCVYTLEWDKEIYAMSDNDCYEHIKDFIY